MDGKHSFAIHQGKKSNDDVFRGDIPNFVALEKKYKNRSLLQISQKLMTEGTNCQGLWKELMSLWKPEV